MSFTGISAPTFETVSQSVRDAGGCRVQAEQRPVLPTPGLAQCKACRAKVRNIGYGLRSDFELNSGRYLPTFGRADDDDTDKQPD
jgi:hypothetical protein